MNNPIRIVSTSDRYDLEWEQTAFSRFDDLIISFASASVRDDGELITAGAGATALVISARDAITEEVLTALPDLKVIGRLSVGLDNIDLHAATRHGVVVTHYPEYCTHEVADHAIAMIYALNRKIVEFDRDLRAGSWIRNQFQMDKLLNGKILALREQTLGIIGLGRIGQQVAHRMTASVKQIVANDPYLDPALPAALYIESVDLPTLLATADIISIHCPLTPETHALIGTSEFSAMKPTGYLVNTARGPIVDLDALDDALTNGQIAGAALDVFYPEPLPLESNLNRHPNLIITPHAAYYSEQASDTIRNETLAGVIDVLRGSQPKVVANPEVLNHVVLRPRV